MLEILAPGSTVYVGEGADIPGKICTVQVCDNRRVLYSVGWWQAGTHYEAWLTTAEFVSGDRPEKLKLQFRKDAFLNN